MRNRAEKYESPKPSVNRLIGLLLFVLVLVLPVEGYSDSSDAWWDEAWPYRIPVTVGGVGVAQVAIDFTSTFNALGLNGALLDIRSLRVVPYYGTTPGAPLAYEETHSTMLENAEAPQIGWHGSGVYWTVNDGVAEADNARFSEGSGSLRATIDNLPGGYGYPGAELRIAGGDPMNDWRSYEIFIYDVWPQVNAGALDQAPDLYSDKSKGSFQGNQGGRLLRMHAFASIHHF